MNPDEDKFVVTSENEDVYRLVMDVTKNHDEAQKIFVVGPKESGKSLLLRGRWEEKDLLSTKTTMYQSCEVLPAAIRGGFPDSFFEALGDTPVLLLDDFEGLFKDDEIGPKMFELLMRERDRQGLDTVVTSTSPLASYEDPRVKPALAGFSEHLLAPALV